MWQFFKDTWWVWFAVIVIIFAFKKLWSSWTPWLF